MHNGAEAQPLGCKKDEFDLLEGRSAPSSSKAHVPQVLPKARRHRIRMTAVPKVRRLSSKTYLLTSLGRRARGALIAPAKGLHSEASSATCCMARIRGKAGRRTTPASNSKIRTERLLLLLWKRMLHDPAGVLGYKKLIKIKISSLHQLEKKNAAPPHGSKGSQQA